MKDTDKEEILSAIANQGASLEDNAVTKNIINGNLSHVINRASGTPAIQSSVAKKFKLILSQPVGLRNLNSISSPNSSSSLIIKCAVCNQVISFPCWYYNVKYAVNRFHYFVCFSGTEKPNCDCLKRR